MLKNMVTVQSRIENPAGFLVDYKNTGSNTPGILMEILCKNEWYLIIKNYMPEILQNSPVMVKYTLWL